MHPYPAANHGLVGDEHRSLFQVHDGPMLLRQGRPVNLGAISCLPHWGVFAFPLGWQSALLETVAAALFQDT